MKPFTFKNRLHIEKHKGDTEDMRIQPISPMEGDLLTYPLQQHVGAPANPLVKKGDRVLLGEKIAEAMGRISANIHSGVSGTVMDIKPMLAPHGQFIESIIIESDGKMEEHPSVRGIEDTYHLTREHFLHIIKEAGLVGLGGAGFPTHIKLSPHDPDKIEYILVNGAECEPYHTHDHRVMLEKPGNIRESMELLLRLFPFARGIMAIETNKMESVMLYKKLFASNDRIEVIGLPPTYPQGSEKQLIETCIKQQVPMGGLPSDIGVIVLNVSTVAAIDAIIRRGRPITRRIMTLSGDAFANPGNYEAVLGMSYKDLVERAGGFKLRPYKIMSGGAMMGWALYNLDIPIIKTDSMILAFSEKIANIQPEQPCIRCAKCVEFCPMGLLPYEINTLALEDNLEGFKKLHGMACVECGSCSYICPSKRHLMQSILMGKTKIRRM
ncbi:MAG: electron transport complex subunit RsxC [Clostridiales bacterium]|jgi:electron transport complex protein RnfC|nr:electron transport complex subunit RsxC [Clostridiales bacterium]